MKPVLFTEPTKDLLLRKDYIRSLNVDPEGQDDKTFGTLWVFCSRHNDIHSTGWCSHLNVYKQPLYSEHIGQARREFQMLAQ